MAGLVTLVVQQMFLSQFFQRHQSHQSHQVCFSPAESSIFQSVGDSAPSLRVTKVTGFLMDRPWGPKWLAVAVPSSGRPHVSGRRISKSRASPKFFLLLVQLAPLRCDHCFAVLNSFLIGCQMLIAAARYRVPYSASGILAEVIAP